MVTLPIEMTKSMRTSSYNVSIVGIKYAYINET